MNNESVCMTKKDKIILQTIFCLGQMGIFFIWFGVPKINTCIGIETILIGNYFYVIGWILYVGSLWNATPKTKFLPWIFALFLIDAFLAIYVWWHRYSFFIGGALAFRPKYILPGYYCYLCLMLLSFVVHGLYLHHATRKNNPIYPIGQVSE